MCSSAAQAGLTKQPPGWAKCAICTKCTRTARLSVRVFTGGLGSPVADRHMLWRALYDTPAYKRLFDEVDELHITRSIPTTMELLLERIRTKSYVSLLDSPTRERLLERVQDLFAQQSDEQLGRQWLDKDAGVWAYPYRTGAWRDARRGTDSRPAPAAAQVARSAQGRRAAQDIEWGREMRGSHVAIQELC